MKIIIAAVSSNHSMSGISRHAANLARCLLTRSDISAVHVLVAEWEHDYVSEAIGFQHSRLHLHAVKLARGTLGRNLWYYRRLPALARQLHADVVHLAYPSPVRKEAFPCPVVTTLHDLYPYDIPSNFGFPKVLFNRVILKECLRNSEAIACVSDSTRLQLGKRIPEVLAKAVTVHNCVKVVPVAHRPSLAASWADRPFFLCVAQHRRNKNIPVALGAFMLLLAEGAIEPDTRFLLIGMHGPETGRIVRTIRDMGLGHRVVMASGISDAEMNWCYRNCELLMAPSILEGFGLPVAEGRLAGCRILCSNIPAFREVGGKGCRFVELGPNPERNLAAAAVASLSERRPLPCEIPHLSSDAIAQQYLRLYRAVTASREAVRSSQAVATIRQNESDRVETKAAV